MAAVETLVDELRDYILRNWEAKALLSNGDHAADAEPITISEKVEKVVIAEQSLAEVSQFPIVYLLADRSRNEHFNLGSNSDDWSIGFDIGVLEVDQDRERLQRKMFRYIEDVIWELLKAGHVAADIKWHLGVGGEDVEIEWGAILTRGEEFMNDAKITVRFRE